MREISLGEESVNTAAVFDLAEVEGKVSRQLFLRSRTAVELNRESMIGYTYGRNALSLNAWVDPF
jgi:hypothetical protein